ncbi:unnamed protein product [Adineta steineri]|uniref:Uncharacterized protein n=1 Tax=Adineta steineri TaxID=433720 RepID=A0A814JT78_9BILA|nr:unnamed protein product [Adineta steineri]CAF1042092.1 unnamed protein product [Adineta steineri]CAF1157461.1 unnamed protein product [Adineta steineri]CAF1220398.1 unnamed protein product [Adineta steineri]CAF1599192.1 unnamed protein product [Adineta steineri]
MNSEIKYTASNHFNVSKPIEDLSKSSTSFNSTYTNYLHICIGEPLQHALASVIIYRPEDPIEFIADFLIKWSCKKVREQQESETKHLLIMHKEKQKKEIVFEYDKHILTSYQYTYCIDPRTDDEREPMTNHFQEQKQQYIHTTYDTIIGVDDDDVKNNPKKHKSHMCHDDTSSSFTYFSRLKDKIIQCDES